MLEDEIPVDQKFVDRTTVGEIYVGKMTLDEMFVTK
jgi:hypothetical protein